ncbi:MAG TPA: RDD family protein [Candidatus Angelobacter sp.]|nr:RDD family protein [Candidatus Angelobacter sp.]
MNCPLCGNAYPCAHSRRSAGTLAQSGNIHSENVNSQDPERRLSPYGTIAVEKSAADVAQEQELWRDQVASRVQQHRARRKGADRDPNMELRFPVQEAPVDPRVMRARRFVAQAAARSPFAEDEFGASFPAELAQSPDAENVGTATPNVIRFPRTGGSQSAYRNPPATVHEYHAAMEELEAEGLLPDCLRITDVEQETADHARPESRVIDLQDIDLQESDLQDSDLLDNDSQESFSRGSRPNVEYVADDSPPIVYRAAKAPPAEQLELPNFDDIQLEATHQQVMPELELGPQPAALGQRMMAGLVDSAIVLAAAAVFNVTFTQLAEENPHSRMALLCAVAVGGVLWTLYQYTFLVHGHGTPGMHLAQLELARFDGKPVSVFDRRCRAVASALSGFSLGLGFLWALVDEDQLGWHDRMTRTLIRSSAHQPAVARESIW